MKVNLNSVVKYMKEKQPYESTKVNYMIICVAYEKIYLLTYVGTKNGKFIYAFQPIGLTAFYEFGLGSSEYHKDLYDYLKDSLKSGYKLYIANSLQQLACNEERLLNDCRWVTLDEIILDKHIIMIDGEKIELSNESYNNLKNFFNKNGS